MPGSADRLPLMLAMQALQDALAEISVGSQAGQNVQTALNYLAEMLDRLPNAASNED